MMKIRIVLLTMACISCIVPDVLSAPFGNAVSVGAAVGAFQGALNGAAKASAGAALAKHVGAIVQFIGSKALQLLAANGALLKAVAAKSAVPVASLGAGVAIGAAVASQKHHIFDHEALTEHHSEPILLDTFPSYHSDHLHESAPVAEAPDFHDQTHELPYGEYSGYHASAPLTPYHSQQYVEGVYR